MQPVNFLIGLSDMVCALVFIGFSIPLLKGVVKPNRFYGARLRKAFISEQNWYRINHYAAKRTIFWSTPVLAMGLAAFLLPLDGNTALTVIFALAPLLAAVAGFETYRFIRKL